MVCKKLPSPLELPEAKVERLMTTASGNFSSLPAECQKLKAAFLSCSSGEDAPVIIFVSKMFAIETKSLPENRPKVLTAEEIAERRQQVKEKIAQRLTVTESTESVEAQSPSKIEGTPVPDAEDTFIAFARIYSGTLKKGKRLFVLGPRHDPAAAVAKVFKRKTGLKFSPCNC